MKRMLIVGAVSAVVLLSAVQLFADIARPKTSPSPAKEGKVIFYTGLTVVPDAKAYEAHLQISQETLNNIRTAADRPANASLLQRVTNNSTRTIMAGLFLFLSISFAGVWLVRSGQGRAQKTVAGFLLVVAVLGGAAIITQANAGPPAYLRWQGLPKALNEGRATSGGVDVEIMPDGNGITLVVPLRNPPKPNEE
jgi:hypothetical protein